MRRYAVDVDGERYVLDVQELSADTFSVCACGRELVVRLAASEDVAEAVISPEIVPRKPPSARPFRPVDPSRLPAMAPATPPPPDPGSSAKRGPEVRSPMPGTVHSVDVAAGDRVSRGDVLLRLEAMKMVNAIRAPRDGVVAEVRVRAGENVPYGQVLVMLEA